MKKILKKKFKPIRLLVMDFDGILTDGHVYAGQDGKEMVRCSRKDGLGINLLQKHGLEVCVISKEKNLVVSARCRKLGVSCFQAVEDSEGKLEILKRIIKDKELNIEQVAYMGDDLNDKDPLQYAGLGITVADAHPFIKKISDYVTESRGGEHAVREICELILNAKGIISNF